MFVLPIFGLPDDKDNKVVWYRRHSIFGRITWISALFNATLGSLLVAMLSTDHQKRSHILLSVAYANIVLVVLLIALYLRLEWRKLNRRKEGNKNLAG